MMLMVCLRREKTEILMRGGREKEKKWEVCVQILDIKFADVGCFFFLVDNCVFENASLDCFLF
jgi:hypothetical protein